MSTLQVEVLGLAYLSLYIIYEVTPSAICSNNELYFAMPREWCQVVHEQKVSVNANDGLLV